MRPDLLLIDELHVAVLVDLRLVERRAEIRAAGGIEHGHRGVTRVRLTAGIVRGDERRRVVALEAWARRAESHRRIGRREGRGAVRRIRHPVERPGTDALRAGIDRNARHVRLLRAVDRPVDERCGRPEEQRAARDRGLELRFELRLVVEDLARGVEAVEERNGRVSVTDCLVRRGIIGRVLVALRDRTRVIARNRGRKDRSRARRGVAREQLIRAEIRRVRAALRSQIPLHAEEPERERRDVAKLVARLERFAALLQRRGEVGRKRDDRRRAAADGAEARHALAGPCRAVDNVLTQKRQAIVQHIRIAEI